MSSASAPDGTLGYWAEPSDVSSSDPSKKSADGLISPPTGWPKCFQENATLKGLLRRVVGKIFPRQLIEGYCSEFEARNAAGGEARAS